MQLVAGGQTGGQIGALLVLDSGPGFDVAAATLLLGERVRLVPRLRQRLYRAPPGCGRPYWADDPAFDVRAHVRQVRCPPPGDDRALLDVAAAELVRPLPWSRSPWSATFVTSLAAGAVALVIVMNHVLADGIAGLAMLAALLDPADPSTPADLPPPPADLDRAPGAPHLTRRALGAPHLTRRGRGTIRRRDNSKMRDFPLPSPGVWALAADAWAGRVSGLTSAAGGLRRLRQGVAELGGVRPPRRLAPTSLNQPTGPRRRLDVVSADLAAVREVAHAHGGTVNDVVLAVVAGALRDLLESRGEQLPEVTASVPVSARSATMPGQLGNQIGVMVVSVPAAGDLGGRVSTIACITRDRKSRARGASAALFVPGFLLLARAGVLRWLVNHQRRVHTFITSLRGPAEPVRFAGSPVRTVAALPATTGNVTVTFAVLSYAGTLRVTVLSDPDRMPDVAVLVAALQEGTIGPPMVPGSSVPPMGCPG